MKTTLKHLFAATVLFFAGTFATYAETPPTVLHVADVAAHFVTLTAKTDRSPQDIRELAVMTFIEAANAKILTQAELAQYATTLEALTQESQNDPEVAAIRGVFYGIQARFAGDDLDALILAKKGFSALDTLAESNPDNGGVLMQRGLGALYAPSFLGRDGLFLADFTALISGRFNLAPNERAYVLYNLGLGYQKMGNAAAGRAVQSELVALKVAPWSDKGAELSF